MSAISQKTAGSHRTSNAQVAAEPLAVVGMACQFPGAAGLREFRRLLRSGRDAFADVPADRWDIDALYDPDPEAPGKMATRQGAFLDRVDAFDAGFFGVTPREAERMDPQQRLLAELCWAAFEHAGIPLRGVDGSNTGVFVGIGASDYLTHQLALDDYRGIDAYTGTGSAHSLAANRLSYLFNLHGPSVAMDTACSSSLVAFYYACQSLRQGDCDLAVLGGVNVILAPEVSISFSKAHMLSPDGCCRPFDAEANGYVRGEGCGVVLVKRLADAVRQQDRILAVVRGAAVNQDGRTVGVSAPNPAAQAAVIRRALADGGLRPEDIGYIEAHGTGTRLGDPVELTALREVLGSASTNPCLVGSVKGNIGHLETASGVASLIKVILMLQHREIYRQANWKQLNPQVSLDDSRLQICSQPQAWQAIEGRRLAGINSFGFGGTNAHVVLEEPPAPEPRCGEPRTGESAGQAAAAIAAADARCVLTISAQDPEALRDLTSSYLKQLQQVDPRSIADFCFSANTSRSALAHRLAAVGANSFQLCQALQLYLEGKPPKSLCVGHVQEGQPLRTAFLFTGQGSQLEGMGERLFQSSPVFREAMEQCDTLLAPHMELPLLSVLYGTADERQQIHQTEYAQPALFALEWSLAQLWRSWGIVPHAVLGHSIGEFVAACLADVMSLEDALWLVAQRARLMQSLPRAGAMAAVFAGEDDVRDHLEEFREDVALAAVNAPRSIVISGRTAAVEEILRRCAERGTAHRLLNVSHAFHSPLLGPILDEFEELAGRIQFSPPKLPLISNLTGGAVGPDGQSTPLDAGYWRSHMRRTVRFAESIQTLAQLGCNACLEIGPTPALSALAKTSAPQADVLWSHSLRQGEDDWQALLENLSALYVRGASVNWRAVPDDQRRQRMDLPLYPFRRERYWISPPSGPPVSKRRMLGADNSISHPLLGERLQTPLSTAQFECPLGQVQPTYLNDHRIQNSVMLPAAALMEMALAADWDIQQGGVQRLENVTFQKPLFLSEGSVTQLVVNAPLGGRAEFQVYSRQGEQPSWTLHATGAMLTEREDSPPTHDMTAAVQACQQELNCGDFYQALAEQGLQYGPSFRGLWRLFSGPGQAVGVVKTDLDPQQTESYRLHPCLLDPCLQVMAAAAIGEQDLAAIDGTYVPTGVRALHVYAPVEGEVWSHAVSRNANEQQQAPGAVVEGDVYLCDAQGKVLAEVLGLQARRLQTGAGEQQRGWTDLLYEVQWTRLPDGNSGADAADPSPPADLGGLWLILSDQQGVGEALARQLRERGGRVIRVSAGDAAERISDDHFCGSPAELAAVWELLEHSPLWDPAALIGAVDLWSLDIAGHPQGPAEVEAAQRLGCQAALGLLQQLNRQQGGRQPQLWLATRGAQSINDAPAAIAPLQAPLQAPLWGLFRVMLREHSELTAAIIDTDPGAAPADVAAALLREIRHGGAEQQLAVRGAERWAARLSRADAQEIQQHELARDARRDAELVDGGEPFRVRTTAGGLTHGLRLSRAERQAAGPGEVEIEVVSAGLNFSDVLKAMNLYPDAGGGEIPLGLECSGHVTAVGEGVTQFQVGDPVIASAPASFSKYVVAPTTLVIPKPDELSFEQAATIPIAFVTAYYALHKLGQIGPGQRVLIHAAAGGVGQAAVQIALAAGAEVFATAGTEEKREFLKLQGVEHVFDSRTLDFAEQVLQATDGRGVDIVLNSLAGEFIEKSIQCLAPLGRFLEIGKTDIYQNSMLGLHPFRNNLSYFAIDLDQLSTHWPEMIRPLLEEIVLRFVEGQYTPLPFRTFPVSRMGEALRYMAQRRNIGKIVIQMQGSDDEDLSSEGADDVTVRADATYLITGGLGSLGLRVAQRLAQRGARSLALLGRRADVPEADEAIQRLRGAGVRVQLLQADVADPQQLAEALQQLRDEGPPVRGVIHAAGVLDDALLVNVEWDSLRRVLAPKMDGAWNLHQATADDGLDFFVLFSSWSSVLGPHGQGSYAAANALLDALAQYRRQEGRPALSISWGPWRGQGMSAAASDADGKTGGSDDDFSRRGIDPLDADEALDALDGLLASSWAHVAVADVNWPQLLRLYDIDLPPFVAELAQAEGVETQSRIQAKEALLESLRQASPERAKELLVESFVATLARVIGQDPERIDPQQPLRWLGVDSLMAIELKNAVEGNLNIALPLAAMFEDPSIDKLADKALELRAAQDSQQPAAADAQSHFKVGVLDPRTESQPE